MKPRARIRGRVEAPPEIVTGPLTGYSCVAYAIEAQDLETGRIAITESASVPFELVEENGTRWDVDPGAAKLVGLGRRTWDPTDSKATGGAPVGPIHLPFRHAAYVTEQHIARDDLIEVEGVLDEAPSPSGGAYRGSASAAGPRRFLRDGLVLRGSYGGAPVDGVRYGAVGVVLVAAIVFVILLGLAMR